MSPKDKFNEFKDQAAKIGSTAKKTFDQIKGAVSVGVSASKTVIDKAGETINKDTIGSGLEKASAGVEIVAKGARVVSNTLESASEKMKKAGDKLKKK